MSILTGTGSRSLQTASNEGKNTVLATIRSHIETLRPDFVMSGMAEGFDKALALVALQEGIPLIAAVPNTGYGRYYWSKNSLTGTDRLAEFDKYLAGAKEVVYVCSSIYEHGVHANFHRNQYMVDRTKEEGGWFLVYDPASKGTSDCLRRIKKASLPWFVVPTVQ